MFIGNTLLTNHWIVMEAADGMVIPAGNNSMKPTSHLSLRLLDNYYLSIKSLFLVGWRSLTWRLSGWWFGTFFIFHNIWDNLSH
jgi:hypothetical protein